MTLGARVRQRMQLARHLVAGGETVRTDGLAGERRYRRIWSMLWLSSILMTTEPD